MNFKDKLDSLVEVMVEFSEPSGSNIEWYESIDYWNRYTWSMVRNYHYAKGESPIIKENVEVLKAKVIEIKTEEALKRFREAGSQPSYSNIGLWKLKEFMESGQYTHVFILGIGELDDKQVLEFKDWLDERLA